MRTSVTPRCGLPGSYLFCLEANIAGDHIRPTFEKLIDAQPSLPTRALRVY